MLQSQVPPPGDRVATSGGNTKNRWLPPSILSGTPLGPVGATRTKWSSIFWNEAVGFLFMIAMSWLTELLRIPHYLFGQPFAPNWHRAALRTFVVLLVWLWVYLVTKRLLKRLHYLEEILRVCGWCRRVRHDDKWMTIEEYFGTQLATRTSHDICPECLEKQLKEME